MGKTHLLIDLALKMICKYPVLYVSLDLSERLLLSRILSASLKIDNQKIIRTQLNDEEVKRIEERIALEEYRKATLIRE
jgi:replicative DNA helicase